MRGLPWWGSVLLAIIAYYGLKYGVPKYLGAQAPLSQLAHLAAPIITIGFLLLAAKQLYDNDAGEPPPTEDNDMPDDSREE